LSERFRRIAETIATRSVVGLADVVGVLSRYVEIDVEICEDSSCMLEVLTASLAQLIKRNGGWGEVSES
jgi:hypothetical protein